MANNKYSVTLHQISNDLYATIEVISTSKDNAVAMVRRTFNFNQSWYLDEVKVK